MLNKKISFWKLMGCGKNGTFDKIPDWRQWAVLQVCTRPPVSEQPQTTNGKPQTSASWWKFFRCEVLTFVLEPIEGHGTWDKKNALANYPNKRNMKD
jgi:hypothetical protein